MQRSSAQARRDRWLRWGRVFFFGVLLGLFQLGLLIQGQKLEEWATTLVPVVGISALLYVLIPALEGFLAAWQSEDALSGTGSGCLVTGIGFLVLVVSFTLGAILTPPQCQPGPNVVCGHGFSNMLIVAAIAIIIFIFFMEGIGSVVGGLLGGWIGGLLGERRARQAHRSSARAAQEPSPGKVPG
jgi:hypothetical protein